MTVIVDGKEHVTAASAAEKLLTTEMKILMLLRHKELEGQFLEGAWFVTTESLEAYRPGTAKPAQQPACRSTCSSSHCGCH